VPPPALPKSLSRPGPQTGFERHGSRISCLSDFTNLPVFQLAVNDRNTIFPWVFAEKNEGYACFVPKSITGKPLIARLRELRKSHALTQEKFSEISGVSYKYYQLIETGKRIDLRLSTLEKLAKPYGIGVHNLLAPNFPKTRPKKISLKV
jgi:DNA-binding XRE family transcriptional regulator